MNFNIIKVAGVFCYGILLFSAASASAATSINACQTISVPGEYVLTANVTSNATCFEVTADDVTIDGDGYSITGSGPNDGNGVNADGV